MRKIGAIFFYFSGVFFSSSALASSENVMDQLNVFVSKELKLNGWEESFSLRDWKVLLDNCYSRKQSLEAREYVLDVWNKAGEEIIELSESEKDTQLLFYCAHALSYAERAGLKIKITPFNNDKKTLNKAEAIRSCYRYALHGISDFLAQWVEMMASYRASQQGNASSTYNLLDAALSLQILCGGVFQDEVQSPVIVVFD